MYHTSPFFRLSHTPFVLWRIKLVLWSDGVSCKNWAWRGARQQLTGRNTTINQVLVRFLTLIWCGRRHRSTLPSAVQEGAPSCLLPGLLSSKQNGWGQLVAGSDDILPTTAVSLPVRRCGWMSASIYTATQNTTARHESSTSTHTPHHAQLRPPYTPNPNAEPPPCHLKVPG